MNAGTQKFYEDSIYDLMRALSFGLVFFKSYQHLAAYEGKTQEGRSGFLYICISCCCISLLMT